MIRRTSSGLAAAYSIERRIATRKASTASGCSAMNWSVVSQAPLRNPAPRVGYGARTCRPPLPRIVVTNGSGANTASTFTAGEGGRHVGEGDLHDLHRRGVD